jgi:SagB-type dehydrogenase family enzyme
MLTNLVARLADRENEAPVDEIAPHDLLFAPSELYHENSKLRPDEAALYRWIGYFNSSAHVRGIISRPAHGYRGYPTIDLPPLPDDDFARTVVERRSSHHFATTPLELSELSRLLYLGSGIVAEQSEPDGTVWRLRAAPSGGAMYPIEPGCLALRVNGLEPGRYAYNPEDHDLTALAISDYTSELAAATYADVAAAPPAACIVLSAHFQRSKVKYGERGYRFALLEAGHIAQNILLAATSAGLAALPVGGFMDDRINALCHHDGLHTAVLYLIFVGNRETEQQ